MVWVALPALGLFFKTNRSNSILQRWDNVMKSPSLIMSECMMILLNIPYRLVIKGVTKWCIWWHPLRHVAKCKIEIEAIFELDFFRRFGTLVERTLKGLLKTWIMGKSYLPFCPNKWKIFSPSFQHLLYIKDW